MQTDNNEVSQYNDMSLHIARLNDIWMACRRKRISGNLLGWKWELDGAQIELEYDANKLDNKRGTTYVTKLKDIDKNILTSEMKNERPKLYTQLIEKEKILREIQQESGKGTKYQDPDDDGFD